jgi:hypothetical protein
MSISHENASEEYEQEVDIFQEACGCGTCIRKEKVTWTDSYVPALD